MINKFQNFMKWVNEQMFKTNPPKEQHMEHVQVQAEEKPAKKPRKPREVKIVAVK
jgi:hypothetical protein